MRLRKIIKAKAKNFFIECEMENGEVYKYDMSFVFDSNGSMVKPLRKIGFFKKVFLELGCLTWPNGLAIDGDSVTIDGTLISS